MAFDRTSLIEKCAPILHLHGFGHSDVAALYAVARRENQKLRVLLDEKKEPPQSGAWYAAWSRAGSRRLAFDRGLSLATIDRSFARLKQYGLIHMIDRGEHAAQRAVNVVALRMLDRAGTAKDLFNQSRKDKAFTLGELDWTKYLKPEEAECRPLENLNELDRPHKMYFVSTFERDKVYMWAKNNIGYVLQRDSDKHKTKRGSIVTPYLTLSRPDLVGDPEIKDIKHKPLGKTDVGVDEFGQKRESSPSHPLNEEDVCLPV
jgi:hypothetical protein